MYPEDDHFWDTSVPTISHGFYDQWLIYFSRLNGITPLRAGFGISATSWVHSADPLRAWQSHGPRMPEANGG
jgi:hypothetical protein